MQEYAQAQGLKGNLFILVLGVVLKLASTAFPW